MTTLLEPDTAVDRDALVAQIRELGPVFAERAVRYDREASFPHENFADLKELGFLGLCVPKRYGGAERYLLDAGMTQDQMARLRARLVDAKEGAA